MRSEIKNIIESVFSDTKPKLITNPFSKNRKTLVAFKSSKYNELCEIMDNNDFHLMFKWNFSTIHDRGLAPISLQCFESRDSSVGIMLGFNFTHTLFFGHHLLFNSSFRANHRIFFFLHELCHSAPEQKTLHKLKKGTQHCEAHADLLALHILSHLISASDFKTFLKAFISIRSNIIISNPRQYNHSSLLKSLADLNAWNAGDDLLNASYSLSKAVMSYFNDKQAFNFNEFINENLNTPTYCSHAS